MGKADTLLTEYVDKLNAGLLVDKEKMLRGCSLEERKDIIELFEMIDILRCGRNSFHVRKEKVNELFEELNAQIEGGKLAVNFRTEGLEKKEAERINKKLSEILEREFDEE